MPSPIKLIAVDMDGTLLNSQHQVSPRNKRALEQAIAQGVEVVVATGRPRSDAPLRILEQLGLQTPGIFVQGSAIFNADGSLRFREDFDLALAQPVLELVRQQGYTLLVYDGQQIFVSERSEATDVLIPMGEPVPEAVGSLEEALPTRPFHKLVLLHSPEQIPALREQLHSSIDLEKLRVVQTLPNALEVIPLHVSKGSAVQHLMDDMGLQRGQVMAFGDAENDIEMIELAGIGVAMGNAYPSVKAVADYVTATNDEDGVALAIERFVLGDAANA